MKHIISRHPIVSYFVLAYAVSWGLASLILAPKLVSGEPIPQLSGLLMFPLMIIGPAIAGLSLRFLTDGVSGVKALLGGMLRWRISARWYAALLLPPLLVLGVLTALHYFVSPAFTIHWLPLGLVYGIAPGLLEEIGWSGYAFPVMTQRLGGFRAALVLGVLWGTWHLPVIDFLGGAYPHGAYWLLFAAAFIFAMTAMRVIIAWVYTNTRSLLLTQLLHAASTASLVIFSPFPITAAHETLWYWVYGGCLWVVALLVVVCCGAQLTAAKQSDRTLAA
ncbi:MAG TPA: CPBP family intramembrane glutamic endopeptidase [Candidatus Acidoferrum sp.]|nr:CPBP family intramembrane glutamic endopeptidase [Candidatus Acidoferrum sp.]